MPQGAPSKESWKKLKSEEWWTRVFLKLDSAREAELATFMFHHSWRIFVAIRKENSGVRVEGGQEGNPNAPAKNFFHEEAN